MALAFCFPATAFTVEQYKEAIKRLRKAGAFHPKGRRYHACFGDSDRVQVLDIWDSEQAFKAFGATLVPILQSVGVQHSEPMVMPVHNVVVPPAKAPKARTTARRAKPVAKKATKTTKRATRRR